MDNEVQCLVSVAIITYNQEKYIKETIDGVLMQDVDFEYEIVIGEDCSSDNTLRVCLDYQRRFPDIIRVIQRDKNVGLLTNYFDTISKCRGKYISQCAGDDYWIDPLKLKRQVEVLENDCNVGMVYTQVKQYVQKMNYFTCAMPIVGKACTKFEDLLVKNTIPAPTICFRRDMFSKYILEIKPMEKDWVAEDIPLFIWFAKNAKIVFMPIVTAVYRVLDGSLSRLNDVEKRVKNDEIGYKEKLFFCDLYNASSDVRKNVDNWYFLRLMRIAVESGRKDLMKRCLRYFRMTDHKLLVATIYAQLFVWHSPFMRKYIGKIGKRLALITSKV